MHHVLLLFLVSIILVNGAVVYNYSSLIIKIELIASKHVYWQFG